MITCKIVIASTILAVSSPAIATTYFSDRTSFNLASGGGLAFESFEAPPFGPVPAETLAYNGFTVNESGGANFITTTAANDFFTGATTDGRVSIWYDDNGNSLLTFSFDNYITAFGIDIGTDGTGNLTIGAGGSQFAQTVFFGPSPQFWGVVADDPFNSISFVMEGQPNVGFDALSFGIAKTVPEPSTWAMLVIGIGVIGSAMRSGVGRARIRRSTV